MAPDPVRALTWEVKITAQYRFVSIVAPFPLVIILSWIAPACWTSPHIAFVCLNLLSKMKQFAFAFLTGILR